jgi:predicted nuclease of predicted toxin-antitoxin system
MRIKLDENMDVRLAPLLAAKGHDVDTAKSEGLSGSDDDTIYQACLMTGRVLMTLDLDFANPFRFPPEPSEGIIVIRPPRPILSAVRSTLVSILPQLESTSVNGSLWIVEPGRIRMYAPGEQTGTP